MNALEQLLTATLVVASAGVAALILSRKPRRATLVATLGAVAGCAVGFCAALRALGASGPSQVGSWGIPGGAFVAGIDPLSACFLLPLFALGALCAVYGRGHLEAGALPAGALNLLIASMGLVVLARHAVLFLVAWELMTLLAFLLITFDHGDALVRRAGWVYLLASHVAFLALWALFVLLGTRAGGALDFAAFSASAPRRGASDAVILSLAFIGFGIKAGVVGLHVWLPEAHAAAPSHVSALMSGIQIKLGIYGLLRASHLVLPGPWFAIGLMLLGAAGALFGIALALQQRDLKRLLAYSSIENVGIILMALGLGFWARDRGDGGVAALAFAAAFLHMWNHAAIKGLLFLGAGSVLHGAGTKDIERLGGVLRRMPWTGRAMLVGAVAIAGLPPLNGFAGEWLLYRALSDVGRAAAAPANLAATGGAAALALVGGVATLCFVRLVGMVLLGAPREQAAANAHESPFAMRLPLGVLALACLGSTFATPVLVSGQAALIGQLLNASGPQVLAAAAFSLPLVIASAALLTSLAVGVAWLKVRLRRAEIADTWSCGYAASSARMQYTSRAFAELFTTRAFPRWLKAPLQVRLPEGTFPASASFASDASDPFTRGAYEPLLLRCGDRFSRLRVLQQGNVQIYLFYIVVTAVLALAWVALREGGPP
jgi:formate hydrogenlyase subunit 3/multisubunit Na+/H+ antiporter MnhD subunit